VPAVRSVAPPSQTSGTSKGIEVGDAYATRAPETEDEDPSDVLRRVQAGMSAAGLSVPLDEQIEVVGEQFYPKEVRKLFRECGMPITAAGCTLESADVLLVPRALEPRMIPRPSRSHGADVPCGAPACSPGQALPTATSSLRPRGSNS